MYYVVIKLYAFYQKSWYTQKAEKNRYFMQYAPKKIIVFSVDLWTYYYGL